MKAPGSESGLGFLLGLLLGLGLLGLLELVGLWIIGVGLGYGLVVLLGLHLCSRIFTCTPRCKVLTCRRTSEAFTCGPTCKLLHVGLHVGLNVRSYM